MNPLDQLVLLITPPSIGWWSSASSWWLLVTLLPLLGWGLWRLRRHLSRRTIAARSEASLDLLHEAVLAELTALAKPYGRTSVGLWLQAINSLLKRVCRACWPNSGSRALSSRVWLAFLDSHCPTAGLTRWMTLVEGGHRTNRTFDGKAVDGLDVAIVTWTRKHA